MYNLNFQTIKCQHHGTGHIVYGSAGDSHPYRNDYEIDNNSIKYSGNEMQKQLLNALQSRLEKPEMIMNKDSLPPLKSEKQPENYEIFTNEETNVPSNFESTRNVLKNMISEQLKVISNEKHLKL